MSGNPSERGRGRGRGRGEFSLPSRSRGRGRGSPLFHDQPSDRQDGQGFSRGRGRGGPGGFGRGRGGPGEVYVAGHSPQPDMRVTRIENETEVAAKQRILSASLPQRPGFGTQGREVMLWANYFELVSYSGLLLYRYSIEILPDQSGRAPKGKKARRVVELLLEGHFRRYGHNIATDFRSNIISRTELDIDEQGYEVLYRVENEDEPAPNTKTYRVNLQDTGTLTASELIDFLTSTQVGTLFGSKEEIIQALNIVMGHHPKAASKIASIGPNRHFDMVAATPERISFGAGLQAVRGFVFSVRAATGRILVNVQVKHAAFYNEGPLQRAMTAYLAENAQSVIKLEKFLKQLAVNVTHIVKKNRSGHQVLRIKVIKGLATPNDGRGSGGLEHPPIVPHLAAGAKEVQFFVGDRRGSPSGANGKKGKKPPKEGPEPPSRAGYISVYDYFQQNYSVTISDPRLPVVNVGTRKDPSYLPADVCEVLPGQPSGSRLSPTQTQQMIKFAVRKPAQNAKSIITSGAQIFGVEPANPTNPTLGAFGITVIPKLIAVPGRVLRSPDVKYGGNKIATTRFGSWNMKSIQFATKADLEFWTYLWISYRGARDPWRDNQELMATLNRFTSKLRDAGINATDCSPGLHISVGTDNLESEINAAVHRFTSHPKKPPPELLLVIVPSNDTAVYNRVKYACDVREGLLNICVDGSKFAKANDQYFANVGLKVNLKLGGINQFLDTSKLGILSGGKTMVVGIDVTHPAPGSSSNAPSVASIVASVDQWLAQWPADLQIQTARQETVSGLENLLKSRLKLWEKHNQTYPENILVYRDGVSEGQYNLVLEQELPCFRNACKELYPSAVTRQGLPYITMVIVGKRHNTRFYPTKQQDADERSFNPQNGTIVDRGVTEAHNWDFFLQSHTAIQGTARPAHYYVIYDEIFQTKDAQHPFQNAADALEDLTHNLCYLFGRATKAVSICPAAYYANLACERARCYLSRLFDPTPVASPAGSEAEGGGGLQQEADPSHVRIHEKVRDAMFYI